MRVTLLLAALLLTACGREVCSPCVVILGDSKSEDGQPWIDLVREELAREGIGVAVHGVGGSTVDDWAREHTANAVESLSAEDVRAVLINVGINEMSFAPAERGPAPPFRRDAWAARYLAALDRIHAAYPDATVYITLPWKRGYDGWCAQLGEWVEQDVVPARSYLTLGDDEREWFRRNWREYSADGVHWTTEEGQRAKASQALAVLSRQ